MLISPDAFEDQWKDEYTRVLKEYNDIHNSKDSIKTYDDIGLVTVNCDNPGHYYSLFSTSSGYDIVLAKYSDNRYEIETKYTTFIDLSSRPVLPRIELQNLCNYLNKIDSSCDSNLKWISNRIVDSGPIARIENNEKHLTKAERYGHPFERPFYQSSIPPEELESLLVSYLRHAYKNAKARKDWVWKDLQDYNRNIDWSTWKGSKI